MLSPKPVAMPLEVCVRFDSHGEQWVPIADVARYMPAFVHCNRNSSLNLFRRALPNDQ
eukprot:SAG31_NODE_30722_length_377_cov_0.546763_1_plen_57_part_01